MPREKYLEAIKERISKAADGSVFVLSDFSDIAEASAVRKAITRIENDKTLIRMSVAYITNPNIILCSVKPLLRRLMLLLMRLPEISVGRSFPAAIRL